MKKYTWIQDRCRCEEVWGNDTFDTIEDCILDAKENCDVKIGDKIAIGTCSKVVLEFDANYLLEEIENNAYEQVGEVSEGWDIVYNSKRKDAFEELERDIRNSVVKYLNAIGEMPKFYRVEYIKTVEVK